MTITFPTRRGKTISPVAELTIRILVIEPKNKTDLNIISYVFARTIFAVN